MEFVELTEQEIKDLVFDCDNFLQSWEMYQRYQKMGRESYFVGVKDADGKVLAAGLMMARPWHFGKKVFRVAGGWLMNYDDEKYAEVLEFVTRAARDFCRKKQGIALEIAPNIMAEPRDAHNNIVPETDTLKSHRGVKTKLEELGYKYLGEYEQVKWTFVLDLEGKSAEELFKEFRTDHRQRIRRAEREGVRLRELKPDELGILKEIAAEAGERHGFKDPDLEYYRSMQQAFGEKVKFVVAEIPAEKVDQASENGVIGRAAEKGDVLGQAAENSHVPGQIAEAGYVPLAASMFVNDGKEMVYLYSGSVRSLQKYGGAHYIQWQMIQKAIEAGCKKYNFYGVYPVEGNGVYNFKLGFRGRVEELLGTFVLPIGWLGRLYTSRLKAHEYGEVH